MEIRKVYAAYGSNINIDQMVRRCPDAMIYGTATLKDYKLCFAGSLEAAVATIIEEKGSEVPVLLWEITKKCEMALNQYEGHPLLYRQTTVKIMKGEQELKAMLYLLNEPYVDITGLPNKRYYKTILEGYKEAGFDTQILAAAAGRSVNGGNRRV